MMRKDKNAEVSAMDGTKDDKNYLSQVPKNSQYDILYQLTLARVIGIIMKAAAFFTEACALDDQITNGDHISKFK